jgi:hypothetical protein
VIVPDLQVLMLINEDSSNGPVTYSTGIVSLTASTVGIVDSLTLYDAAAMISVSEPFHCFVKGNIDGCMVRLLPVARESKFTFSSPHVAFLTKSFSCIVLTSHPKSPISVWSMFLVAMMYDCLVLSIATYHLLKMKVPGTSL